MYRFEAPGKRRSVLVLTRQEVIPMLHSVIVAITSTRGAPSEVWHALAVAAGCSD